jgi:hypothetical protein
LVLDNSSTHNTAEVHAWLAAHPRNKNPTPFAWTKPARALIRSRKRMLDRFSTAVH